jgi:hypothetical protein
MFLISTISDDKEIFSKIGINDLVFFCVNISVCLMLFFLWFWSKRYNKDMIYIEELIQELFFVVPFIFFIMQLISYQYKSNVNLKEDAIGCIEEAKSILSILQPKSIDNDLEGSISKLTNEINSTISPEKCLIKSKADSFINDFNSQLNQKVSTRYLGQIDASVCELRDSVNIDMSTPIDGSFAQKYLTTKKDLEQYIIDTNNNIKPIVQKLDDLKPQVIISPLTSSKYVGRMVYDINDNLTNVKGVEFPINLTNADIFFTPICNLISIICEAMNYIVKKGDNTLENPLKNKNIYYQICSLAKLPIQNYTDSRIIYDDIIRMARFLKFISDYYSDRIFTTDRYAGVNLDLSKFSLDDKKLLLSPFIDDANSLIGRFNVDPKIYLINIIPDDPIVHKYFHTQKNELDYVRSLFVTLFFDNFVASYEESIKSDVYRIYTSREIENNYTVLVRDINYLTFL